MNGFVPGPDALPLPAPVWLFTALLHLTLLVHLLLMNALLGGGLLALLSRFSRERPGDLHDQLFRRVSKLLPTLVAGTVTFGVAPLLFLQVLYGQFFYTATIIMGWPWFLVTVFLILAYYGLYLNSFRGERLGDWRGPVFAASVLLLLLIGFVFSNVSTLALTPDRWPGLYFHAPGGTSWNLGEPTLWPRWLHMALGTVAVGGLWLALLARWRGHSPELRAFLHRRGMTAFLWGTALNVPVGLWLLTTLPRGIRLSLMGGSPHGTGLLVAGLVLAAPLLWLSWRGRQEGDSSLAPLSALTVVTMLVMILLRQAVRDSYLAGLYRPQEMVVRTQGLNLVLFAVLLVGCLAVVVWMLRRLLAVLSR